MRSLRLLLTGFLVTGILFFTLTMGCDRILAGETYGAVYGFPLPWHAQGATSMSRTVWLEGLMLGAGFYLALGALLAWLLLRLAARSGRTTLALMTVLVVGFLGAGLPFAGRFLEADFVKDSSQLTEAAPRCRVHVGAWFDP